MNHAFECLECDFDWRMPLVPATGQGVSGHTWQCSACPACGHLYFEWLSFDLLPSSVFLMSEWSFRPYYGSFTIEKLKDKDGSN